MADRFAVASGNWNDTSTWSDTPAGAPGSAVPTSADDVNMDGFIVTLDINAQCNSLASSGLLTVSGARTLTVTTGITLTDTLITVGGGNSLVLTCPTVTVEGGFDLIKVGQSHGGAGAAAFTLVGNLVIPDNFPSTSLNFNGNAAVNATFTGNITVGSGGSDQGTVVLGGAGSVVTITGNVTGASTAISLSGTGARTFTLNGELIPNGLFTTPLVLVGDDGWTLSVDTIRWVAGTLTPFNPLPANLTVTNWYIDAALGTFDLPAVADVRSGVTFAGGVYEGELTAGGGGVAAMGIRL